MPTTWSEPLSALDATFLYLEDRSAHMHVGGVAVFEGKAPSYDELVRLVGSRLDRVPRYRQRVAFVPGNVGRPVWIDAADLDLEFHIRHTALPAPGGDEALKKLAGRLFSQQLDRGKPLWELWLIEGLGENRFAVLSKTHHCMVDGVSGVDLATVLMDFDREVPLPGAIPPWRPRAAPSTARLVADALERQITEPIAFVKDALGPSSEGRTRALTLLAGLKPLVGIGKLGAAKEVSINQPIGPHRRWEMASLALADVRAVRAGLGGTVNDVILAVVAGAMRALFAARGESQTDDLRAMVPVSVRRPEARGTFGNQVAAMFCPLPVGEADPKVRLSRVSAAMKDLKESQQAVGAMALTKLSEFAPPTLLAQAARLGSSAAMPTFMNLVVTNVPGPQVPLYLLGQKMLGCYPCVPLAQKQSVGIALLSYDGTIRVGLLGDADAMNDLALLAEALPAALAELVALAGASASGQNG